MYHQSIVVILVPGILFRLPFPSAWDTVELFFQTSKVDLDIDICKVPCIALVVRLDVCPDLFQIQQRVRFQEYVMHQET